MDSVLDRLRHELDTLGDRVSGAIEQGRLHVEKLRLTSLRKDVAAELGLLEHSRARGGDPDEARRTALLERLDELHAQLARVERELRSKPVQEGEGEGTERSAADSDGPRGTP
jgi:hypothetical protein